MAWSLVVLIYTEAKVTNSSTFTQYFSACSPGNKTQTHGAAVISTVARPLVQYPHATLSVPGGVARGAEFFPLFERDLGPQCEQKAQRVLCRATPLKSLTSARLSTAKPYQTPYPTPLATLSAGAGALQNLGMSCPVFLSLASVTGFLYPHILSDPLPLETASAGLHNLTLSAPPLTSPWDTPLRNSFSGHCTLPQWRSLLEFGAQVPGPAPFLAPSLLHTLLPFSKHRVGQHAPPSSSIKGRGGVGEEMEGRSSQTPQKLLAH